MPLLYTELRRIAARLLADQGRGHTLQPTALVHEAWLRLADQTQTSAADRMRFLRLAARAMRFVLVDHARARCADKRGGGRRVTLDLEQVALAPGAGLLELDQALEQLTAVDPELARLVELRFFAGLSHAAVADTLGVSLRTVERQWRLARAFLIKAMGGAP